MSSNYVNFDVLRLGIKEAEFSEYQRVVNNDPFEWSLQDVEVTDGKTNLPKIVKSMKLSSVYLLLDAIYETYDTEIREIRLLGKAVVVTVRLMTIDKDGVVRSRDGTGFVDASGEGVRNASSMAEANAIKNAAKKLGKVFGRDLYAEDEAKKESGGIVPDDEDIDPVISVDDEGVNPVYIGIVNQLRKVIEPEDLRAISSGMLEEADCGNIDGQEFEHLTELINNKINELKKAKNGKVKQSRGVGEVPGALHGGVDNKAAGSDKRRKVRGSCEQSVIKKGASRRGVAKH